MRLFNLAVAAMVLAAGLSASVRAQTQPRAAAETADRIERISRIAGQYPEYGARAFQTPRGANLEVSRRLGTVAERMSFGAREFNVRRKEVLGVELSPASLEAARALGFEVLRSFRLETLGIRVDVLQVPRGESVKRALRRLREADPSGAYEPNSLFEPSGADEAADLSLVASRPAMIDGGAPRRVGIIDTGADLTIDALSGAVVAQENFGRGDEITPRAHGTAVAALARYYGADQLVIADAFSGDVAFADAEALARSLDWMAAERIEVINMSLAGPPNGLLELAVKRMADGGHVIVAAVGNEGPDASPQFPAAYPSVIGVTAVDADNRIYERANRGEGVDVAALGVGVTPPGANVDRPLSGTSYATPLVSAYLARRMPPHEAIEIESSMALIRSVAVDLGEPGFDTIYGAGLLSPDRYRTASGGETN
ncbi:MAG: S8 family serine peptidase [Pseudomonadota bacterium]|nr:S8 family serine peptidase [Pseudomonadota bacterium]